MIFHLSFLMLITYPFFLVSLIRSLLILISFKELNVQVSFFPTILCFVFPCRLLFIIPTVLALFFFFSSFL